MTEHAPTADILILARAYAAMEVFRADEPPDVQPQITAFGHALEDMANARSIITSREAGKPRAGKVQAATVIWTPRGSLPDNPDEAHTQLVLKVGQYSFDASTRSAYAETDSPNYLPGPGIFFNLNGDRGPITITGRTHAGVDSRRPISGVPINRGELRVMRLRVINQALAQ